MPEQTKRPSVTGWQPYFEDGDGWADADNTRVRRRIATMPWDMESVIARIRQAAEGLTDVSVEAATYYESADICVIGNRPMTDEEREDRERANRFAWIAAKARYEAGREAYEKGSSLEGNR